MPRTCRHADTGHRPQYTSCRSRFRPGILALVALMAVLVASCSSGGAEAAGPVRVEIISLDHAPIRPATQEASDVAAEFGDDVTLSVYNFDTPEGDTFADDNGLTDHTPIAIFINGESEFDIDGRSVQFLSFPQGEGTGVVADGNWAIEDLRTILTRAVNDLDPG